MIVSKWGNSLAIRLPADVVETLGLKEGDEVNIKTELDNAVDLQVVRALKKADAIRELRKFRGMRPDDYVFDRDEANER